MPLIAPATHEDLDDAVRLFAGYQRFYAGEAQTDEHNRSFLARFVAPSEDGLLLLARDEDDGGAAVGLANLYWTFSSVTAVEHAHLNDLFVVDGARGGGVGEALIDAAAQAARERGSETMSWMTAVDNRRAQRLYERVGAERSIWFEYELAL